MDKCESEVDSVYDASNQGRQVVAAVRQFFHGLSIFFCSRHQPLAAQPPAPSTVPGEVPDAIQPPVPSANSSLPDPLSVLEFVGHPAVPLLGRGRSSFPAAAAASADGAERLDGGGADLQVQDVAAAEKQVNDGQALVVSDGSMNM